MLKHLNKLRLNKLIPGNLSDILNLNKDKKTYIIIFSLIILTIFTVDFTNKNISNNQLINKEIFDGEVGVDHHWIANVISKGKSKVILNIHFLAGFQ